MSFKIERSRSIEGFAIIVDINGYTKMVADPQANMIAQFTRDVLSGGIKSVEDQGGIVVGFMGDAFLGFISESENVYSCCLSIGKDLDKQCEYISTHYESFPYSPTGPSLKIAIEYGTFDVSEITSEFLGSQKLFAGAAINHAARISAAGSGNRCLIGPQAYENGLKDYTLEDDGPLSIAGKEGEPVYIYYKLNLDDIWIEGESKLSYWG